MKKFSVLFLIGFIFLICSAFVIHKVFVRNNADRIYNNCELGDLVGDDVKRLNIGTYYADYHSDDFSEAEIKNIADICIKEGIKTQYQMDCCISKKIYPDN